TGALALNGSRGRVVAPCYQECFEARAGPRPRAGFEQPRAMIEVDPALLDQNGRDHEAQKRAEHQAAPGLRARFINRSKTPRAAKRTKGVSHEEIAEYRRRCVQEGLGPVTGQDELGSCRLRARHEREYARGGCGSLQSSVDYAVLSGVRCSLGGRDAQRFDTEMVAEGAHVRAVVALASVVERQSDRLGRPVMTGVVKGDCE